MEEKNEELFADLHIHSRFSRACSKELTVPNLVKWARIKGIGLLGTGDFTHEVWLSELKELKEENGILWYEDDKGKFPFILSSEISLIYTHNGKGRRIHLLYLAPSIETVEKINVWLDSKGRRDYDGRPIFKISCRDFAAKMQEIDERIEVICAHAWTPWFGIFGSLGGFDSLEEAFGDKVNRIHAIETGISSDPEMNWKIKEIADKNISIISFSDSHSFWPWRLGREATIFKISKDDELSYDLMLKQIRENSFIGTVETDPAYGKYHYDGHSKCNFSCPPEKTREIGGICPICNKKLIVGVDYRVEALASKGQADYKNKKMYYTLLPLHEIISLRVGAGMNTKRCWEIYDLLINNFENEFNILIKISKDDLLRVLKDEKLVYLIMKNREGKIKVKPGYDGEYGQAMLKETDVKKENTESQELFIKDGKIEKQTKLF